MACHRHTAAWPRYPEVMRLYTSLLQQWIPWSSHGMTLCGPRDDFVWRGVTCLPGVIPRLDRGIHNTPNLHW
jgi:hypothetical protein